MIYKVLEQQQQQLQKQQIKNAINKQPSNANILTYLFISINIYIWFLTLYNKKKYVLTFQKRKRINTRWDERNNNNNYFN